MRDELRLVCALLVLSQLARVAPAAEAPTHLAGVALGVLAGWVFACFRGLECCIGAQRGALVGWLGPALVCVCLSLSAWSPLFSLLALLPCLPVLLVNQRLGLFKQARGLPRSRAERFNAWTWAWLAIAGMVALLLMLGPLLAAIGAHSHIKADLPA